MKKEITTKNYGCLIDRIAEILTEARSKVVREINKAQVLAYWEIGRNIVEFEQKGKARAEYGEELLIKLSADLTAKFSKGFSERNLRNMRAFYLNFPIWQTLSAKYQKFHTLSGKSETLSRKSKDKKCRTLSGKFIIRQTHSAKSLECLKSETPSQKSIFQQTLFVKFE